jgi:hypothetical protein
MRWDRDREFKFVVSGMSDLNFNQCPETRKSVSGNITELNGVPVLVKSVMQETMKLSVTEAELDSATKNVQDMLFVKQIIESMGLKVKIPMVLRVDNQGVRELVNNWSVGGRTRHVATKAMFLRELKEWGLLKIEFISGSQMCADLLTKNLPGPLFSKHSEYFVSDAEVTVDEDSQARESAGMKESGGCSDVVSKEKLDSRPAEECACVAPADKKCEGARLRSLVQSGRKNEICDSMNSYQINAKGIKTERDCRLHRGGDLKE